MSLEIAIPCKERRVRNDRMRHAKKACFGIQKQDACIFGSKYVSCAKCMALTLSSLNGLPNDPADREIRLKIHERLTKNVSLHVRLKIRELGKMHGNNTEQFEWFTQ